MSERTSARERIAENPRLTAAAFTALLLLTQAGNAAAEIGTLGASGIPGP